MYTLVSTLFRLYEIVVVIRVLFSWINVDEDHPAVRLIYRITEPLLGPIRQLIPNVMGIDFSPFLLLLALSILQQAVLRIIFSF